MDARVKSLTPVPPANDRAPRPRREEAEAAVRTLIAWAGDDPEREGLLDTPARVTKAYGELFAGYGQDASEVLSKTFKEVGTLLPSIVMIAKAKAISVAIGMPHPLAVSVS